MTNKLLVTVLNEEAHDVYDTGFLDYAMNSMIQRGDFDIYSLWLKSQPVSSFSNIDNWTSDDSGNIVYTDEEGVQTYPVTMMFVLNGENIYHSLTAGNSFFFRALGGDKMEALYVD